MNAVQKPVTLQPYMCAQLLSYVRLFATLWTAACQAPLFVDFPSKNTGVGRHALLQGIIPTQVSNPVLPHCRWILYQLSHQGNPMWLDLDIHSTTLILLLPCSDQSLQLIVSPIQVKVIFNKKFLSIYTTCLALSAFLILCVHLCTRPWSLQSCPALCSAMDCSLSAPLSTVFSRQEYCSGLSCFPQGDLPNPETEPTSLMTPALAGRFFTLVPTWEAQVLCALVHILKRILLQQNSSFLWVQDCIRF